MKVPALTVGSDYLLSGFPTTGGAHKSTLFRCCLPKKKKQRKFVAHGSDADLSRQIPFFAYLLFFIFISILLEPAQPFLKKIFD